MPTNLVTAADLHLLIPEIFVCAAAFALLMVDLFLSPQRRGLTHFLALLILVAAAVLTVRDMATVQSFAADLGISVRTVEARSVDDASSSVLSIWASAAMPARTPTGMLRNTKHSTRIAIPPVNSSGATLNATMYATPMTVPGIAKLTMVRNSNVRRPANWWRVITYAESRPTIAVSGADTAATSMVVNRLSHAEPVKRGPPAPHSMPNPEAKWPRCSVRSPRPMSFTNPPVRMTP